MFEGLFEDTAQFGGSFTTLDPRFLVFADDEVQNVGPFGDPTATFTLPLAGVGAYTVAIVNFASGPNDGGDGRFNFNILGAGDLVAVPEPSSAIVIAAGGLVLLRRRRSGNAC